MLMEKDIKVLRFLNDFGISTISNLKIYLEENGKQGGYLIYRRVMRLIKYGFVEKVEVPLSRKAIYRLSLEGIKYLGYTGHKVYRYEDRVSFGKLVHDNMVQEVALEFYRKGQKNLISERAMKHTSVTYKGCVPDFSIESVGDSKFAVEIELEAKSLKRIMEKFSKFNSIPIFRDVLYLVGSDKIANNLKKCYKKITKSFRLHLYDIEEFYASPEKIISEILSNLNQNEVLI